MPLDAPSTTRLQAVCPALSAKIASLAAMLEDEGVIFRITQGVRSWADQQQLWEQGRDSAGNIIDLSKVVTKAPPGHSWHEFGLAVDFVPMVDSTPDWDTTHPQWDRIITVAKSLGMFSGRDFKSILDIPHLQLTGTFPESPTDEVRQIFLQAGMSAVWVEAGLVNANGTIVTPQ